MYMYKNVRNDFLIVAQWIMMDHFYGIVILFRWKAREDDMIYTTGQTFGIITLCFQKKSLMQ